MNIFITISQGQSIRDFLIIPTIRKVLSLQPEATVVILSPAHAVPQFLEFCQHERVVVRRMEIPTNPRPNTRLVRLRKRVLRGRAMKNFVLNIETKRFKPPDYLLKTFEEYPPDLVVSTHPMTSYDYEVFATARKLGIKTLAVVKSWDNLLKGLTSACDSISVWNKVNYEEAIKYNGYKPDEVTINGAISFDPYFDESWYPDREEFIRKLGFNPERPIITLATAGSYPVKYYEQDETHLADDLLRIIDATPELKEAQIIVRLHPISRLEKFLYLKKRSDLVFSYGSDIPTIGWYINHEDLVEQIGILKYSDIIVTPGGFKSGTSGKIQYSHRLLNSQWTEDSRTSSLALMGSVRLTVVKAIFMIFLFRNFHTQKVVAEYYSQALSSLEFLLHTQSVGFNTVCSSCAWFSFIFPLATATGIVWSPSSL